MDQVWDDILSQIVRNTKFSWHRGISPLSECLISFVLIADFSLRLTQNVLLVHTPVSMCLYRYVWVLWKPEEGVKYPDIGVTGSCETT